MSSATPAQTQLVRKIRCISNRCRAGSAYQPAGKVCAAAMPGGLSIDRSVFICRLLLN